MRYWQYLRVVVGILEHNHKSTIVKFSWRLHIKLTAGITGITGPWKPKYLLEIIGNVLRGSFSWFSFLRSFWQKAFLERRRKGRFCSWSQKSKISSGSQDVFERSKDSDSLLKPKNRLPSPVWQPPLVDQSPWETNIFVCYMMIGSVRIMNNGFFLIICRWKREDENFQPDNVEKICYGRLLRLLGLPKTENKLIKDKVCFS